MNWESGLTLTGSPIRCERARTIPSLRETPPVNETTA